ncbi:hypothetical protein FBZ84_10533 [Azospirillum baldaniorum]|nr:hypothetical protein FBZ84_10533 [Azospirillum baldaniorum]
MADIPRPAKRIAVLPILHNHPRPNGIKSTNVINK